MSLASLPAADPGLLFWSLVALHIVGVASMFATRLPHSSGLHTVSHHVFIACLICVGMATMFTICVHSNFWVWSGTTFSLMAVGATAELGTAAATTGF